MPDLYLEFIESKPKKFYCVACSRSYENKEKHLKSKIHHEKFKSLNLISNLYQ